MGDEVGVFLSVHKLECFLQDNCINLGGHCQKNPKQQACNISRKT